LTPKTTKFIFRTRLNRKRNRLYGSVQTSRYLNRCRDSDRNREVRGLLRQSGDRKRLTAIAAPVWRRMLGNVRFGSVPVIA